MARCELDVDVQGPGIAGGTITGSVYVRAPRPVTVNALTLRIGWIAEGAGVHDWEVVREVVLHEGELSGGERFPFEVDLPPGPVTYLGRVVKVNWFAVATADVDWAFDPKAQRNFAVIPGPAMGEYVHGDELPGLGPFVGEHQGWFGLTPAMEAAKPWWSGVSMRHVVLSVLLLLVAIGPAVAMRMHGLGWVPVLWASLWLGVPAGLLVSRGMARAAMRRVGPIRVRLNAFQLAAGETVEVDVAMAPLVPLEVTRVEAVLTGNERAAGDSDTSTENHLPQWHEFLRRPVSITGGSRLVAAGERVVFSGRVTIPIDAPPSFYSRSTSVRWALQLRFGLSGCPDWTDSIPIAVRPAPRTAG